MKLERRPASEMKDSGVEWIGQIPREWGVYRLKEVVDLDAENINENYNPDEVIRYVDITAVESTGLVKQPEEIVFSEAPTRARRKIHDGDTIVSTVRPNLQAIAYFERAEENLIASTGFTTLSPKPKLKPKFVYYYTLSHTFLSYMVSRSVGVSYPAVGRKELAAVPFLIAPDEEQIEIISFLDSETSKIQKLIGAKTKQIGLLREHEKYLVHHAVTKGLDPKAKMKDSGVEWIGKIPEEWSLKKIKHVCDVNGRVGWEGLTTADYVDEGPILLGASNIQEGKLVMDNYFRIPWSFYNQAKNIQIEKGDILLVKVGATIGKTYVVEEVPEPMTVNAALFVLKVKPGVDSEFLNYLLSSKNWQEQIFMNVEENARGNLFQRDTNKIYCIRPPEEEQEQIISFLNLEASRIHAITKNIKSQISKLEEYRKSLIYEVVTGKAKVKAS